MKKIKTEVTSNSLHIYVGDGWGLEPKYYKILGFKMALLLAYLAPRLYKDLPYGSNCSVFDLYDKLINGMEKIVEDK